MAEKELSTIVASNIQSLRRAKGLTQSQLAQTLNYSDKSISKWELGYAIPSVDILKDIADYFGVSVDYMLESHEADDAKAIIEGNSSLRDGRKWTTIGLTVTFIWMVFAFAFVANAYNSGTYEYGLFLWPIPASFLAVGLAARVLFKNYKLLTVMVSVSMWTLLATMCIYFQFIYVPAQPIWYFFVLGIPGQMVMVFLYQLKIHPKNPSKKNGR